MGHREKTNAGKHIEKRMGTEEKEKELATTTMGLSRTAEAEPCVKQATENGMERRI